ncbi:MAG TPA: hydrogenase small subunit [Kineosporiaceae bacterium]|nr:hydrogenase small subunit [Kineosporiaceae bacterium]
MKDNASGDARSLAQATGGPQWSSPEPGSLAARLMAAGVSRRSFLNWSARITAVMALPPVLAPEVAQAVETAQKPNVLWFEFQDCTGDTESFLRSRSPGVGDIILDVISVDYHETIMAAAGTQAEKSLADALAKGGHILVIEGSVPLGAAGAYCVIGGKSAKQRLEEASKGAAAIINVGTCSAYGGLPAASPNPTGAVAVSEVVSDVPIINLPGCPANVDNITATIVHYLTFKQLPPTDDKGRPLFAYGERIHDNCPRRGHFDAGNFALAWGDEGHRKGWCLYKLGCKGPSTWHNCPTQQWNGHTQWPIGVGSPCFGCSEPGFWDTMTPFYDRLPHVSAAGHDLTADKIGLGLVGATFVGATAHGVAKVIQQKRYFAAEREESSAATVSAPTGAADRPTPSSSAAGNGDTEKGEEL